MPVRSDDSLYQIIGDKVQRARDLAGVSQAKLAAKLGLHRVSIVNIERGRQRAPVHVLWRLAQELHVELVDLIPRREDFDAAADGIHLSPEDMKHLENVTKGDLPARRDLETFIRKAKERPTE